VERRKRESTAITRIAKKLFLLRDHYNKSRVEEYSRFPFCGRKRGSYKGKPRDEIDHERTLGVKKKTFRKKKALFKRRREKPIG